MRTTNFLVFTVPALVAGAAGAIRPNRVRRTPSRP